MQYNKNNRYSTDNPSTEEESNLDFLRNAKKTFFNPTKDVELSKELLENDLE